MYSDDIDLSYRILKIGKSNYYFHKTAVIHYKGESTVKDEMYMKRFREAMHFFYKKHFKVSFFFDIFMKMGAFFFSIVKKNQAVGNSRKIDKYLLISREENLRIKVENLLGKKVQRLDAATKNSINSLTEGSKQHVEMIFDNNHLSFKFVIESMETLKNLGLTFKILPQNASAKFLENNRH